MVPLAFSAIGYSLSNWTALTRLVDDGRIEAHNNAAERALRGVAIGRKNYLHLGRSVGSGSPPSSCPAASSCATFPRAWDVEALLPKNVRSYSGQRERSKGPRKASLARRAAACKRASLDFPANSRLFFGQVQ